MLYLYNKIITIVPYLLSDKMEFVKAFPLMSSSAACLALSSALYNSQCKCVSTKRIGLYGMVFCGTSLVLSYLQRKRDKWREHATEEVDQSIKIATFSLAVATNVYWISNRSFDRDYHVIMIFGGGVVTVMLALYEAVESDRRGGRRWYYRNSL